MPFISAQGWPKIGLLRMGGGVANPVFCGNLGYGTSEESCTLSVGPFLVFTFLYVRSARKKQYKFQGLRQRRILTYKSRAYGAKHFLAFLSPKFVTPFYFTFLNLEADSSKSAKSIWPGLRTRAGNSRIPLIPAWFFLCVLCAVLYGPRKVL